MPATTSAGPRPGAETRIHTCRETHNSTQLPFCYWGAPEKENLAFKADRGMSIGEYNGNVSLLLSPASCFLSTLSDPPAPKHTLPIHEYSLHMPIPLPDRPPPLFFAWHTPVNPPKPRSEVKPSWKLAISLEVSHFLLHISISWLLLLLSHSQKLCSHHPN